MKYYFLPLLLLSCLESFSQNLIEGSWEGDLKSANRKTSIKINLKDSSPLEGTLSSSLGLSNIPIPDLSLKRDSLYFTLPSFGVSFKGKIEINQIKGLWNQGELVQELTFYKNEINSTKKSDSSNNFTEQEVTVLTTDSVSLSGTLLLPIKKEKVPAVLLLTVAGPNDRDQSIGPNKPFKALAEHLALNGIASLRLDDRGIGGSKGNLMSIDFEQLKNDAISAVQFIKSRSEIDSDKIGIIGNSEGTVIAAMASIDSEDVAFTVMLGAVGVPLSSLLPDRLNRMNELYKLNQNQKVEILHYLEEVDKILLSTYKEEQKRELLKKLKANQTFDAPGFNSELFFLPRDQNERINFFLTPYFLSQIEYKPQRVLTKVTKPVLVINGSLDPFQSPENNFPEIITHLIQAGNKDVTLHIAPDVNHIMQDAKTGLPTEYAILNNSFSPKVLEAITNWLEVKTNN